MCNINCKSACAILTAKVHDCAILKSKTDRADDPPYCIPTNHTDLAGTVPISRVVISTQKCPLSYAAQLHSHTFSYLGTSSSRSQVCKKVGTRCAMRRGHSPSFARRIRRLRVLRTGAVTLQQTGSGTGATMGFLRAPSSPAQCQYSASIHVHTHTHIHTHTYIHIYTHIHVHKHK